MATVQHAQGDGIRLTAYRGDQMALLAFDLDQDRTQNLAGFAVKRTPPLGGGEPVFLFNRLSFEQALTSATAAAARGAFPSDQAPFQKFRWIDVPSENIVPGSYTYTVTARYFQSDGSLADGASVSLGIELAPPAGPLNLGFTRGYLSSQGYARRFQNRPIRPAQKGLDYDTAPFEEQYAWLGFHARELVFAFLDECLHDPQVTVDAFVYDLDEPDFVRGLQSLGHRLRLLADDADLHNDPSALEPEAWGRLRRSAGEDNVHLGHFERFAHSKVLIQRRNDAPVKVLTGSANFSVRGLYVQANSVMVINSQAVARLYADVFELAFSTSANVQAFRTSPIASTWHDVVDPDLPWLSVCFSPHQTKRDPASGTHTTISLQRALAAVNQARSSVLFAIMALNGAGALMDELKRLAAQQPPEPVLTYGVSQARSGLHTIASGQDTPSFATFTELDKKHPQAFQEEVSGGPGRVIHHKFVVVDFSGTVPIVFTGSSNLSRGGETDNGDNLLAITDPYVVTAYAVEAMRLFDHYRFRDVWQQASATHPLQLQGPGVTPAWWEPYYDSTQIKCADRQLFGGHLGGP